MAHLTTPDIILLSAGLLLLCFGWLLYKVVLSATGAVFGAAIGLIGAGLCSSMMGLEGTAQIIALASGGLLGLALGIGVFHALGASAIFLCGAVVAAALGVLGAPLVHRMFFPDADPDVVLFAFPAGAAVAGGLIFFLLRKFFIALGSAALGSFLIMSALHWPFDGLPLLLLFPLGFYFQMRALPKKASEADAED